MKNDYEASKKRSINLQNELKELRIVHEDLERRYDENVDLIKNLKDQIVSSEI